MNETLVRPQQQMEQTYVDQQFADIMGGQFSPVEQAYFSNVDPYSMDAYLQGFANVQLSTDTLSADTPLTAQAKEALFSQQLTFAGIGQEALARIVAVDPAAIVAQRRLIDELFASLFDDEESKEDSNA